jgi:hypothetical protein
MMGYVAHDLVGAEIIAEACVVADLTHVDLELVLDGDDEFDPDVFRGLLAERPMFTVWMVKAGESVGIWSGGDVEEFADQFVEVAYGVDLSCVVIIDGDAEYFFGADDELYDVQTHVR